MVVLARNAEEYAAKGLTPEMIAGGAEQLSEAHGMPMSTAVRDRVPGTLPACTAVVATRLHAPEQETAMLRALRLRNFGGENLDDQSTIDHAAADIGLEPDQVAAWMDDLDVKAAVEADATAARHPAPAALVLDGKLASWEHGRRYTCPSYELCPDGNRRRCRRSPASSRGRSTTWRWPTCCPTSSAAPIPSRSPRCWRGPASRWPRSRSPPWPTSSPSRRPSSWRASRASIPLGNGVLWELA